MNSMRRVLATASTVVALSGMFRAPVAQAGDTKIQQANTCFRVSGAAALVGPEAGGRFVNNSSVLEVGISCPILRDNPAVRPLAVRVGVRDASTTVVGPDDISCRVQSASQTGITGFAGAFVSTPNGANTSGTILNLPLPTTIPTNGTLSVYCIIPRKGAFDPASWVASILIDEP